MPLTVKAAPTQNFESIPEGSHVARCVKIVDLGTQKDNYQGQVKEQRKIRITWETPLETKIFKPENGEQPYLVSKEFTLSVGKKSKLKPFLEAWRGLEFSPEELEGFDIEKLLGAPCMIQVLIKTSGSGNQYADIASIMKLPKGTDCPPQITPSTMFSFESPSQNVFDNLSEFEQNKIKASPEYIQWVNPNHTETKPAGNSNSDDDLPF